MKILNIVIIIMFGPEDYDCIPTGQLASIFCDVWGENSSWMTKTIDGPHEANFLKLDCSKIKNILNWKTTWNVNKAIEKTVEFAKEYAAGKDMGICMDNQIKEFINDRR